VSGDRSGERGWMSAIDRAVGEGALEEVDWREDVTPDTAAIARRPAPEGIDAPPADAEVAFTPDLLLRPRVIPLRTSTPATAIRHGERSLWARGDGLGRVRGTIVHRAIEAAYALPRPEGDAFVDAITAEEADDLDEATRTTLATEAREMLARFRESPTGRAVEAAGAAARFEAPFAWDWDGIPVHGQIDLLVPEGGRWRVIDFKTDRVQPGGERAAAQGYLVQIGLYARALEAATGQRPAAGLLFLRTGTLHEPSWDEMDAALAAARVAVDAGMTLDAAPEYPEYPEYEAEPA
ncbi:MAG: PD-(D/E)XK nuclease family protein, partial [Dehalococcoidia bacterium]